jgi:diguanylate cyclase (GGDEF)-like protein
MEVNLKRVTDKTLRELAGMAIVMPSDYERVFRLIAKEYDIDFSKSNDEKALISHLRETVEFANATMIGAETVSESAKSAQDAISKNDVEMLSHIEAEMANMAKEMEMLRNKAQKSQEDFEELKGKVYTDTLTKARSRAWLSDTLLDEKEIIQKPGVLAFIDLNNFKHINDKYGHIAGDNALAFVSSSLVDAFAGAEVIRFGGDEFVIFIEDSTSVKSAEDALKHLKSELPGKRLHLRGDAKTFFTVDFSFGCAAVVAGDSFAEAIKKADSRMYAHKFENKFEPQTDEILLSSLKK